MSRGNAGQCVFPQKADFSDFMHVLEDTKRILPFELFAYCLMPNHFHLLLRLENMSLSRIMQRLLSTFAHHSNRRTQQQGHVFQGRFKSVSCRSDPQCLALLRYIHLNPVRAGLVEIPEQWPWSGHGEYLGANGRHLIDWDFPLTLFNAHITSAQQDYQRFIAAGMDERPLMETTLRINAPYRPADTRSETFTDIFTLATICSQENGISLEQLRGRTRRRQVTSVRRLFITRALQAGVSAADLSRFLGIAHSAVRRAGSKGLTHHPHTQEYVPKVPA